MSFEDLYREIILDHYRNPRNKASLDHISDEHVHENPACGDSLKLQLSINGDGRVESLLFDGRGCAISMASASIMTELVKGMNIDDVYGLVDLFIGSMRGEEEVDMLDEWGDLACLKGVAQYPVRVKCATLAWNALQNLVRDAKHDDVRHPHS